MHSTTPLLSRSGPNAHDPHPAILSSLSNPAPMASWQAPSGQWTEEEKIQAWFTDGSIGYAGILKSGQLQHYRTQTETGPYTFGSSGSQAFGLEL